MLFEQLERLHARPEPFSSYTAENLWTDSHTSERMLGFHLDGEVAMASRTTEFIERSVRWILKLAVSDRTSRLLDLGCGPGLYANRLALAGVDVVGVDFSEPSIRHAKRTADPVASPAYLVGNYLELDVPGDFDLVLLAMCDFCALSPEQRRQLLLRVRSWLRAGGRFIFDVYGMQSLRDREEAVTYAPGLLGGFWSSERYHGFLHTFVYEDEGVLLDKYEIIEASRSRTIYNWLQHFDETTLTRELKSCGLVVDDVFGDLTGASPVADPLEFCVVASSS